MNAHQTPDTDDDDVFFDAGAFDREMRRLSVSVAPLSAPVAAKAGAGRSPGAADRSPVSAGDRSPGSAGGGARRLLPLTATPVSGDTLAMPNLPFAAPTIADVAPRDPLPPTLGAALLTRSRSVPGKFAAPPIPGKTRLKQTMRAKANSVSAGSDSAVIGDTDTHVTLAPATSNPLLPQADALRYGIMQIQVQRRQFAGFLGRSENPASWTRFAVVALQNLLLLYQFDKDMALATEDLHLHSPNGPFAPCGLEADAMVEFSARLFGSGNAAVSALQLTSQHTLIEVLDVSRCILRVSGLSERKRLMIGTRGKSGGRKEEVVWWIHFDDADSMYRWYVLVKHLLQ